MKYYVRVELRDYDDNLIATNDNTCEENIKPESVLWSAKVAAELLVKNNLDYRLEQTHPKHQRILRGNAANDRRVAAVLRSQEKKLPCGCVGVCEGEHLRYEDLKS